MVLPWNFEANIANIDFVSNYPKSFLNDIAMVGANFLLFKF